MIIVTFVAIAAILSAATVTVIVVVNFRNAVVRPIIAAAIAVGVILVAAVLANFGPITASVSDGIQFLIDVFLTAIAVISAAAVLAVLAINSAARLAAAGNAQAVAPDHEAREILRVVSADADAAVEVLIFPIGIAAESVSALNAETLFSDRRISLPQVRNIFQHRNLALNEVAVQLGILTGPVNAPGGVIHPALQKQPVPRLVCENLPCGLAVVQGFLVGGVCHGERDERNLIPRITRTAVVVLVLGRVERMAARQGRTAMIAFRIAHRDEMRRVDGDIQLEPDFLRGQLVRKLRVQPLEIAARRFIRNAQCLTKRLENAALFLVRGIGFRGKLLDGRDALLLKIGVVEKPDGVINGRAVVCPANRFAQDVNSQRVDPVGVRVVCSGPVDNQRVEIGVPHRGLAEQLPQLLLCVAAVGRKLIHKVRRAIVHNARLVGVLAVIADSLPDILFRALNEFTHVHFLLTSSAFRR